MDKSSEKRRVSLELDRHTVKMKMEQLLKNQTKQEVLDFINEMPLALEYAGDYQKDEQVVLAAVSQVGTLLRYAKGTIANHDSVVKKAVMQDPWAIMYASKRIKNNLDIAKLVVSKDHEVLRELGPSVRQHKAIIKIVEKALLENKGSDRSISQPSTHYQLSWFSERSGQNQRCVNKFAHLGIVSWFARTIPLAVASMGSVFYPFGVISPLERSNSNSSEVSQERKL
ncbi:MAG: DUF4116 domain-containing protein [Pseudomonadota bacterium]|nr:DUF4116 domain-containing protein [Pseudomonadota bacterium]